MLPDFKRKIREELEVKIMGKPMKLSYTFQKRKLPCFSQFIKINNPFINFHLSTQEC